MSSSGEENEELKCWICLCGADEPPPMGTMEDARDFINPCGCKLRAHRRCLLDWISGMDLKLRVVETTDESIRFTHNGRLNISGIIYGVLGGLVELIGFRFNQQKVVVFNVDCPQCKAPIFVTLPSTKLFNGISSIQMFAKSLLKYAITLGLISSMASGLVIGATATLSKVGLNTLNLIAPRSIQSKLFGLRYGGTLENAMARGWLSPAQISIIPLIPLYMLSLRADYYSEADLFAWTVSFSLFMAKRFKWLNVGNDPLNIADPRFTAVHAFVLRLPYVVMYKLCFNRIYYRWVLSLRPCFAADRIPLEELRKIEADNEEEYQLNQQHEEYQKRLEKEEHFSSKPFIVKVYEKVKYWLVSKESQERRAIYRRRLRRELVAAFTADYSHVFRHNSALLTFLTTIAWPYAGKLLSFYLLGKISALNNLGNTPDQSLYIRNLAGCALAVILKDFANLFLSWLSIRGLRNMKVVEFNSTEWRATIMKHLVNMQQNATSQQ